MPLPGLGDLQDERAAGAEHAGVDVLPAHSVEEVVPSLRHAHQWIADDLLHAVLVHLADAAATFASLSAAHAARPPGLRYLSRVLAVAAVDEQGGDVQGHVAEAGVHQRHHVGRGEIDLLVYLSLDQLADLPVQFSLDRLGGLSSYLGPQLLLAVLQGRVDPGADEERIMLDLRQLRGGGLGEAGQLLEHVLAQPARFVRRDLLAPGAALQRHRDAHVASSFLVRGAALDLGEQPPQAMVAQVMIQRLIGPGNDGVHECHLMAMRSSAVLAQVPQRCLDIYSFP